MTTTRVLTERRKADRKFMAEKVRDLAVEMGCTVEIEEATLSRSGLWVNIKAARGLCLTVTFEGDSCQPDVHVLSWHMASCENTCLADAFGHINIHHFQKSTDVAYGFENLLEILEHRFRQIQTGVAFDEARTLADIAKRGTKEEQLARWAEWRAEEAAKRGEAA